MTDAERLALITHDQVRHVLQEAELVEAEARAFCQDRARQRRPYGSHTAQIIPFPKTGKPKCATLI
jgi:hypothetical protein